MTPFALDGWATLQNDLAQLTNFGQLALAAFRLLVAAALGGLLGYQRERMRKAAGVRTHMLVALGSAFFVLAPQLEENIDLSRVIQGVVTGIGFLGAGAILKLEGEHSIRGLMTAASIWLTAAVGLAVGVGRLGISLLCAALALGILAMLPHLPDSEDRGSA